MIKINTFIIVSFVTIDTPYEAVLDKYLLPSLNKFCIKHYIAKIENKGS